MLIRSLKYKQICRNSQYHSLKTSLAYLDSTFGQRRTDRQRSQRLTGWRANCKQLAKHTPKETMEEWLF